MWNGAEYFQDITLDNVRMICENLQSEHTEIVMQLYEKMKHMPYTMTLENKSEERSNTYRTQGNNKFRSRSYHKALIFYNMALCYAPRNSQSFKLAYCDRSELLFETKEFNGALKDIETCYLLGCPDYLQEKLRRIKNKCNRLKTTCDLMESFIDESLCATDFLALVPRHGDEIPCASSAVKLDTSEAYTKFVAAEDINVGTIVALDTAFVNTSSSASDAYLTCYHCMKCSLNLIPCPNCCLVMFCDEACQKISFDEYHATECKILCKMFIGNVNLALKAVIKMKNSCGNWEKFIDACNNIKTDQTEKLQFEKDFPRTSPFFMLHGIKDTCLPLDKKANRLLHAATLIKLLEDRTSYFPIAQHEKLLAMHATAKLLTCFFLYSRKITFTQCAKVSHSQCIYECYKAYGYYVFLNNFEHSCHPNLIVAVMNNEAVVTAIQPIRRGTPLTISYIDHYIFHDPIDRASQMLSIFDKECSCRVCDEQWGATPLQKCTLSSAQKMYLQKMNLNNIELQCVLHGFYPVYQKICLGLKLFVDSPNTKEYKEIFAAFFRIQQTVRCKRSGAKLISPSRDMQFE